jgi:hypothetical protein
MITLTADTATLLFSTKTPVTLCVVSDSATVTRLSQNKAALDDSTTHGFGLTCYDKVIVHMAANSSLYAKSAGTPNITVYQADKPEMNTW